MEQVCQGEGLVIKDSMRIKWWDDPRAILAFTAVVGALFLQGLIIVNDLFFEIGPIQSGEIRAIPTWAAATVSAIVGFYFGGKSAESTAATMRNGTTTKEKKYTVVEKDREPYTIVEEELKRE